MAWMRAAIGVGGGALVVGVVGMFAWIDNGSHYFELAVALASAGFLTLVACVLTSVFASSHGSQDDAFIRGKSMGYDAGFLEGHRTARPVVVPIRRVDRGAEDQLAVPVADIDHAGELNSPPTNKPLWRRDTMPLSRRRAKGRVIPWVWARRIPLLAGALCLALVGVLVANAMVPTPVSAKALRQPSGTLFHRGVPPSGGTPALVSKPEHSAWSVSVGVGGTLVAAGVAGASPAKPGMAAVVQVAPAVGAAAIQPVAWSSLPGVAVVAPSTPYLPVAPTPATTVSVGPAVAVPVASLTVAQQTAADALAASNLTKANAAAAAASTAATASAAAAATASAAASAAEKTRLQALADAYAVAHPGG